MEKQKIWDLIFKVISSFLAIGSFVYGIYIYDVQSENELNQNKEQRASELRQNEKKFRQKIYEEQYELYSQAVELASILANTHPDSVKTARFLMARREFNQLYWGKLNMVEVIAVEEAMVRFHSKLRRYGKVNTEVDQHDMQQGALLIAYACRTSLNDTWDIDLSDLARGK